MKSCRILFLVSLITLYHLMHSLHCLSVSLPHCEKNIAVKYQVPITKIYHTPANNPAPSSDSGDLTAITSEVHIDYEERLRWNAVRACCPGYRTIIFGFCEAICINACPPYSVCAEPNTCKCIRGYKPSHHPNKEHPMICRPVCSKSCPAHSHCVAPNVCECRSGYRDLSSWFRATRCERVRCGRRQRYDVLRRVCVPTSVK